jgi:phosphopantothenoylcysteine decarboxylase/phosphopantothenate--cysteine ligase
MHGREILLGVTGGIAAYKSADLCSKLVQVGARVSVVMTAAAGRFIGATTFEALTGRPVLRDLFEPREHFVGEHIGLARRAEVMIVAPATADFLAKVAHGLADDLLAALALTFSGPALFAPAMNDVMWAKPSVQRNVRQVREDGFEIIEPTSGWLSCGVVGTGRMAEVEQILARVRQVLESRPAARSSP